MQAHDSLANNAAAVTYAGGGSAVIFWGLHLSDLAVMISTFASVCGVGLQFYLAFHRAKALKTIKAEIDQRGEPRTLQADAPGNREAL